MVLSNQKLDRAIAIVISNLLTELNNSALGFDQLSEQIPDRSAFLGGFLVRRVAASF